MSQSDNYSPDLVPIAKTSSPSSRVRRVPVFIAAIAVIAGAVAVSRVPSDSSSVAVTAIGGSGAATITAPNALSSAWYCAEGTSSPDGRAPETVIIGNLENKPMTATVTVMTGTQSADESRQYQLKAYEQRRVEIADLVTAPEVGVVVEVFDGRAVVEHEVTSGADFAVSPCATKANSEWYFADVSTDRAAMSWLTLFNPFDDDSIVDVKFLTESGTDVPDSTQSLSIPRRSRVSIPIHETVRRESQIGVVVRARTGRVVSEVAQYFDGSDTRTGVALSLGTNKPSKLWYLSVGDVQTGSTESISIANFGAQKAQVKIRALLGGNSSVLVDRIEVPAATVARVDLGTKTPAGIPYALEIRSKTSSRVVVEALGVWAVPAPATGVASLLAAPDSARRWAFAVGRLNETSGATIEALNTSSRPLTIQLYAYVSGDPNSPRSAPASAVAPGERAIFDLAELGIGSDQVLVISADGPIVAGRKIIGVGVSLAPGVPFANSVRRNR